jgi:uncharacterized membrane protein YccC
VNAFGRLSAYNIVYSIAMALACLISFWIMTHLLNTVVVRDDDLLGGMWAAVAAAFVFRDTGRARGLVFPDTGRASFSAGVARLVATSVSFALCLVYLSLARPSASGMALVLAVGTVVLILIGRRDEIITTAITTIVVMVVAILNPADALSQPLLRLMDTVVGIAVGVACSFAVAFAFRGRGHGT